MSVIIRNRLGLAHTSRVHRPAWRVYVVSVANLVDNAIAHNVEGGRVQKSMDAADGKAVLTVTNTGPVIPPDEIDRLFQRG